MRKHLTDGELRASLDGELESAQFTHLADCADCQTRQRQLQAQSQQIAHKLAFLAPGDEPVPVARTAWSRFSQRLLTQKETSMIKKWFAFPIVRFATVLILFLALVLAFPSTRALADELLNLFRVQQVTVIPVDFTGLKQLTGNDALGSQISELISSSTEATKKPGDPVDAADAGQASEMAGFNVRLPQNMTPSRISVTDSAAFTLTVDREKAQALLDESGRSDLVLPKKIDGAKISVEIPASVSAAYGTCPKPLADESKGDDSQIPGRLYPDCVILAQIPSPTVNAPADVDVAQLAQIGLEFTGMSSEEAAAFTSSVDWTSTLVVPIPKNAATYEQVTVDGVTGTLIQRPADDAPQFALLWVKDGIVYAISGLGTNSQQAIKMAKSLP
jgi:Domain of unknown function (DUF4367)